MRQFKHLKKSKFLSGLEQMPWSNVDLCSDPNEMLQEWKQMFVRCMGKHVPRNLKKELVKSGLRYILHSIFLFRFIRYMPTVASLHC